MMMQRRKQIKNFCCSGGGFFGYAEIGVLKELENYKEYLDIKNVKGVSVGSIVAALYAVGYEPEELAKIMFDMDFDKLIRDTRLPYIKLYEKYGMYEANKLEEEIERLIRVKTNIKFCTFCQIEMNLTIISTNLNMQRPRSFDRHTDPDMVISKAVRLSISYPLVMTPILYDGDLMGDGGEFLNYPITTFSDSELEETIGITFAAYNENNDGTLKSRIPINDIYDYIKSLGLTMSRAAYVSQITPKYLERSIIVHITENISSMQFNLTKEQKKFIYECGVKAVREQVERVLGVKPILPVANVPLAIPEKEPLAQPPNSILDSVADNMMKIAVKQIIESHPEFVNDVKN